MIELKKMRASTAKNFRSFSAHQIIEISYSAYIISKDQDKFVFFMNNHID